MSETTGGTSLLTRRRTEKSSSLTTIVRKSSSSPWIGTRSSTLTRRRTIRCLRSAPSSIGSWRIFASRERAPSCAVFSTPRLRKWRMPQTRRPVALNRDQRNERRSSHLRPRRRAFLTELRVFDNSEERDVSTGTIPPPRQLLLWRDGTIVSPDAEALAMTPDWAKPIIARALKLHRAAKFRRPVVE
jgi:hypothetical protein